MVKRNNDTYIPENSNEEALMLMGRVNAFAAYVRNEKYLISRNVCADMLGFELGDGGESDEMV